VKTLSFALETKVAIEEVWQTIATANGISGFMSPSIHVVPEVGGPYEIYFDPDGPAGTRGSEGMRVLTVEAPYRFGFTWNNPPVLASIRGEQTAVFIELSSLGKGTRIELHHTGFGHSKDWYKSYDYFTRAWGAIVLPKLAYAIEIGPYPWGEHVDLGPFVDRVHKI